MPNTSKVEPKVQVVFDSSVNPYKALEIAIAVLVEHGGGGGHNAAPIAMRLFDEYFSHRDPVREATKRPVGKPPAVAKKRSAPRGGGA